MTGGQAITCDIDAVGCTRFQRQLVNVENEAGGGAWLRNVSFSGEVNLEAVKLVKGAATDLSWI